jgi:sec-independent protein translocase protein TatC
MASKNPTALIDPEDMFADTRMSFGDHIEDLRSHLLRAIYGFIAGMVICLLPPIGPWALKTITAPVEQELKSFYDRYYANRYRDLAADLTKKLQPVTITIRMQRSALKRAIDGKGNGAPANDDRIIVGIDEFLKGFGIEPGVDEKAKEDWVSVPIEFPDLLAFSKAMSDVNRIVKPEGLSAFNVQETFVVYVKIGMLVGFIFSSPWVFYQVWSFVAVGLYPHEKRLVNYYLPVSLGLFLFGCLLCQFFALPKAIEALLWFNEWLRFEPELRLNEWLGFALLMPLVFGLSFQTPLVMLFMFKIGVADIDSFRRKRRLCYFIMAVFSAIITPSTDAYTMMFLWLPMCLLFEVGIWLCMLQPKSLSEQMDDAELDEMIGV